MHLGENIDRLRDPEEEEEEALSLCELPLDNEEYDEKGVGKTGNHARLSTETTEFFSFLSDLSIDMCPADDIIFCGKLVPLKDQQVVVQPQKISNSFKDNKKSSFRYRKRSESLSDLQSPAMSRSDSMTSARVLRNSRSLDYQRLHRMLSSNSSSPDPSMDWNSSGRSLGKSDAKKAVMKPRWYVLMFGMLKFPPEMELKDIKNRQFRRIPSVMFPPVLDDSKKPPPSRSSGKTAWRFLKALSCRDPTSIEATPSFCMPHA